MNIDDSLIEDVMIMNLQATDKRGMTDEMVQKLCDGSCISDIDTHKEGILEREIQTSTGLGDGITIPHTENSTVEEPTVFFTKSKKGVNYEVLDGRPTYLFFMITVPEGANNTHLQALAALSRLLIDPDFVNRLEETEAPEAVQALFQTAEGQKEAKEEAEQEQTTLASKNNRRYVIAVTACPTGIARTYMAGDALKRKAKGMGVDIRVETNDSEEIKNRSVAEDIAHADSIIVAAGKKVEMNRFDSKKLVNRSVSDGTRKTEELVNLAISGEAPTFHNNDSATNDQEDSVKGSIGSHVYKDLMNGVSHMLPFVIGGEIVIALSFMIDQFIGVLQDQLANLGNYNGVASWFNQIGGAAFGFMLPVLAGFVALNIGDRPGLVANFAASALANAGGTGFLGALTDGFLAGYVVVLLRKVFKGLPELLDGVKTILFYPVFGLITTGLLVLVINIPMKATSDALNHFLFDLDDTNAALLGALLAGMMVIGLGGPVNKAAYILGTAALANTVAEGGSVIMASVMTGGMVPPLIIFVAARLFKNKFTKDQQDTGLASIIIGLSFATEETVPFAAVDPLRVIPSFVVDSAFIDALVSAFGIKLLAPHGGIFVVFLLSNPLLYLLSVLIGAIISGIVYGLLKKPVEVPA